MTFAFLLPTFNFFADSSLFVSMENRFQGVHKLFSSLSDSRQIKDILISFHFFEIADFDTLFALYVTEKMYKFKRSFASTPLFLLLNEGRFYAESVGTRTVNAG